MKLPLFSEKSVLDRLFFICSGFVGRCSLMDGLYHSTLECFYEDACVDQFNRAMNFQFQKFNASGSRFPPTTRFGSILDEHLLESLEYSSNYSNYFRLCSPSKCQYSYRKENSANSVFTALLGLYGGLTSGLKVFVWYGLHVYHLALQRCFHRLERVFPSPQSGMRY